jgi:hypothetical protein
MKILNSEIGVNFQEKIPEFHLLKHGIHKKNLTYTLKFHFIVLLKGQDRTGIIV